MGHGVLLSLNSSLDETYIPESIELLSSPIQTVFMSAPNIAFWNVYFGLKLQIRSRAPFSVLSWNFEKDIP